jgi:hypothetical protein
MLLLLKLWLKYCTTFHMEVIVLIYAKELVNHI